MKRKGDLFSQIIDIDNIYLGAQKALVGKKTNPSVKAFYRDYENNIQKIREQFVHGTYRTGKYKSIIIEGIKKRHVQMLPHYDNVAQHAIMNVVAPVIHKTLTYNTYSCVKGRGIEGCANRVSDIIRKFAARPLFCLKIDIKKYYPSIDHDALKEIVVKIIKDKRVLDLLFEIIDSAEGLPIGNYTSLHFANLYLAYFMHWVNEELQYVVQKELGLANKPILYSTEYADDIVFFSDSKEVLHSVFRHIRSYLHDKLRLTIKPNYQVFPIAKNRYDKSGRGLDYVGYVFYRNQKLIRKRIKKNLCRKISKLNKKKGKIEAKEYVQQISSWLGWAKHSDSKHLLKHLLKQEYYENIL